MNDLQKFAVACKSSTKPIGLRSVFPGRGRLPKENRARLKRDIGNGTEVLDLFGKPLCTISFDSKAGVYSAV